MVHFGPRPTCFFLAPFCAIGRSVCNLTFVEAVGSPFLTPIPPDQASPVTFTETGFFTHCRVRPLIFDSFPLTSVPFGPYIFSVTCLEPSFRFRDPLADAEAGIDTCPPENPSASHPFSFTLFGLFLSIPRTKDDPTIAVWVFFLGVWLGCDFFEVCLAFTLVQAGFRAVLSASLLRFVFCCYGR